MGEVMTQTETKQKLIQALKHWTLDYSPAGTRYGEQGRGGRPGSRVLIPYWAMPWISYQIRWLKFSKSLPKKQKRAAELYHIGEWTDIEISKELNLTVGSVQAYRSAALNTVVKQIDESRAPSNQCPRCGGSLVRVKTLMDSDNIPVSSMIQCLACCRNLTEIVKDITS